MTAREIQERAVEWVVQRQTDEAWNETDQAALDTWLAETPEHTLAYWRAEDGWNRTELLGALRSFRPDARQPDRTRSIWFRRAAVTAVFAILGGVAASYFAQSPQSTERTYSTVVADHKTLAIADGSQIEMNTNTLLRANLAGGRRQVVLEKGEAFFQIKHDAAHPFTVYASGHRIVDLGTKFLVKTQPDRIEVALVEGRARVDSNGASEHSALLKPGDVAVATATSISVTRKAQPTLAKELAWPQGNLVFANTALADVAAEFNRYNRQKIVITDPRVARLTIVGTFSATDVDAIINTAHEVFGLHATQRNGRIVISH